MRHSPCRERRLYFLRKVQHSALHLPGTAHCKNTEGISHSSRWVTVQVCVFLMSEVSPSSVKSPIKLHSRTMCVLCVQGGSNAS